MAMLSRSLGHRAPLLWVVLPLIAGLVWGRIHAGSPVGLLLTLALSAAAVALAAAWLPRVIRLWPLAIAVAFACSGAASYELQRRRLAAWEHLPAREVTVVLRIERLFAPRDPRRASGLARITATADPAVADLAGQRVYYGSNLRPGGPAPRRQALLTGTGVLVPVAANPPAQSFEGFLASSGVNFRLTRTRWLREDEPPPAYYRFCAAAGRRFEAILGTGIAAKRPELAGLLRAMMLGQTAELTEEQHTVFMQSGTMHLFAISGLNIGVIAAAIRALLRLVRLPPAAQFLIGAPILWLFVDITGAAPSAVRAFAMAVFFEAAVVVRRPGNALAAVVGSAAIVLLAAPLQLFSASFLMSYVIVLALLVLGLPLSEMWLELTAWWRYLPRVNWTWWHHQLDDARRALVVAVAIGVATTLVSALTGVEFFNLLTPGSLVANLILIPAAMLVTVGGFASLLFGLLGLTPWVVLCNHATALVLLVIEHLVRISVHVPGAFIPAQFRAPWVGGAALAAMCAALLVGYGAGWRRNWGGWWPPFAVIALTLAFGVRYDGPPAAQRTGRPVSRVANFRVFGVFPDHNLRPMKSAYELAMERLAKADPSSSTPLTAEQKSRLAEIDRLYKGKLAEREIFLQQQLDRALADQKLEDAEKIKQQLASERARIEEDREAEKERVRKG